MVNLIATSTVALLAVLTCLPGVFGGAKCSARVCSVNWLLGARPEDRQ